MEKNVVLAEGLKLRRTLQQARLYRLHDARHRHLHSAAGTGEHFARAWGRSVHLAARGFQSRFQRQRGVDLHSVRIRLGQGGRGAGAEGKPVRHHRRRRSVGRKQSGGVDPRSIWPSATPSTGPRASPKRRCRQLSRATDILPREPHRSAGFAVLKAPDVPAVLIELGYLSNSHDDGQMDTERWRDAVASAIASAVDRNFASGPSPACRNGGSGR